MTEGSTITVVNTGETYFCPGDTPLLDAALGAGLRMRHNCRGGACGSCKAQVLEGEVDHGWVMSFAITDEEKEEGYCLTCQSKPRSPSVRLRMVNEMQAREAGDTLIAPAEFNVRIIAAHPVTATVLRLVVGFPPGTPFLFRAGMNMEIEIPGVEPARSYSIVEAPDTAGTKAEGEAPDGQLTFFITRHLHGHASTWLHEETHTGDSLTLRGPYGEFALPQQDGPVLALAGGTGLSPILSVVQKALASGAANPIHILFSVRERKELFGGELLDRLARRHHNFTWQATLTRERVEGSFAYGRIPELLEQDNADLSRTTVLIAGSPAFVDACTAAVRARGAEAARITTDSFLPHAARETTTL